MSSYFDRSYWQLRELQQAVDQTEPLVRSLDPVPKDVLEKIRGLDSISDSLSLPADYLTEFDRARKILDSGGNLHALKLIAQSDDPALAQLSRYQQQLDDLLGSNPHLSDDFNPARRVLDTLASTEALMETSKLTQGLLAESIQPQIAYQQFAIDQLQLAVDSSSVAQANRVSLVSAAADLLDEISVSFGLAALLYPEGQSTTPVRQNNIFVELNKDIERIDLEDEERDLAEFVVTSRSGQVTALGALIVKLIYNLNAEAERDGKELVFKPTNTTMYSCSVIPSVVATDEETFSHVVDHLYFLLYEGSAEAKRLPTGRLGEIFDPLWTLKHLRLGFRHDVDHGSERNVAEKNRRIGQAYVFLIGKRLPRSHSDWGEAQVALYGKLVTMLNDLWLDAD